MADATDAGPAVLPPDAAAPPSLETVPLSADPVEALYQSLAAKVRAQRPTEDLAALDNAYAFAAHFHREQKRDSGEPYMIHPLQVTHILADMKLDLTCLAAGLLHDVVEDTPTTNEDLKKQFGDDVARIVDGVTKLAKLNFY